HEISIYRSMTGHFDPSVAVPNHARRRSHFPGVGGVVTRFAKGGALPASVTLPGPVWFNGVSFAGTHAGFLGPGCDPYELRSGPRNDLRLPDGLDLPRESAEARLGARRRIQQTLDAGLGWKGTAAVRSFEGVRQRALSMLSTPAARRALDLELENDRVRDRFGRNIYGESFLMARRLIEGGGVVGPLHLVCRPPPVGWSEPSVNPM